MPVEVKIRDSGESADLKRIKRVLREELTFRVGITEQSGAPLHGSGSGLTIVETAALHEFGVGVPQRPFVRGWFENNQSQIGRRLVNESRNVFKRRKLLVHVARKLGPSFERSMKSQMQAMPPPLAQSTVRKKGRSETLVDTFQVYRHITHEAEIKRRRLS